MEAPGRVRIRQYRDDALARRTVADYVIDVGKAPEGHREYEERVLF